MTKDDLQTIFASQIAAGITSVYYMLYDDNGKGGTKCSMAYGSLSDLDTLATTLVDYNYLQPDQTFVGMTSFINKACAVSLQPIATTPAAVAPVTETTETITQPTITGTWTPDDPTITGTTTTTTGVAEAPTDTTTTSSSTSTTDQTTSSASTASSSTPTSS
jgi:hypothetical protein